MECPCTQCERLFSLICRLPQFSVNFTSTSLCSQLYYIIPTVIQNVYLIILMCSNCECFLFPQSAVTGSFARITLYIQPFAGLLSFVLLSKQCALILLLVADCQQRWVSKYHSCSIAVQFCADIIKLSAISTTACLWNPVLRFFPFVFINKAIFHVVVNSDIFQEFYNLFAYMIFFSYDNFTCHLEPSNIWLFYVCNFFSFAELLNHLAQVAIKIAL